MGEVEYFTREERIAQLQNELSQLTGGRRDDFDQSGWGMGGASQESTSLIDVIQNPRVLTEKLGLTDKQAGNVKAIIAGAGAGLSHKYLSKMIGDELAAMVGAGLAAYIAKRLIG